MDTLHSWFCLKPGRDNFKLRVKEDRNLILCHNDEIDNQLIGSIEQRFATNEPIKMLIYGDYGVGKTHAAHHISWWLEQNHQAYPAKAVMIEVGDIDKKSRFDVLVRPFLEELGVDFLVELTSEYQRLKGNTAQGLREAGVPEYIAMTLAKLNLAMKGMTPPQVVQDAIQILQGRKPGSGWASNGLGLQLTESKDFFAVLHAVGEMYRAVHGHRIVFIADEAARLDEIDNDETTQAHWVAVNRDIFDDKNNVFGFIYTLSGKTNRLPQAIWHPQLQNRIGPHAFELKTLAQPDVERFVDSLVKELVDGSCVEKRVESGEIPKGEFDSASYPFSKEGRARFIDYFKRSQENAKPRDICDRMNSLGFFAIKFGSAVISDKCLEKGNM